MKFSRRTAIVGGLIASVALTLAGCSNGQDSESVTTSVVETTSNSSDAEVTFDHAVIRASSEDNPMTSVFGTLINNTDEALTVTGFTADAPAQRYELHEVVDGHMQEKAGGFTIPAGQSYELAPGGDHLMIMGLESPVEAGDVVSITVMLEDGSEVDLGEVPVRTIAAGDESYGEDNAVMGHNGVDESEHSGH